MAATDQNYRSQRTLDIVFAVSCVLMLVSVVWMFAQDYFREFKVEQREFRDIESAMAERALLRLLPGEEKREAIKTAAKTLAKALTERNSIQAITNVKINAILPEKAKSEAKAQSLKAEYDSEVSIYNIHVEERNAAEGLPRHDELVGRVKESLDKVNKLKADLAQAQDAVDEVNRRFDKVRNESKAVDKAAADAEDEYKRLTESFDRYAKLAVQKEWKIGDSIRALPVLDAFYSPTRIQQYTLEALPIDYNFKYVTRYDRCTTCHQGIDKPSYTKEALTELTETPSASLQKSLNEFRALYSERRKILHMQETSFNENDLPSSVKPVALTGPRINEFAVHPRLDLFVDGNSPHGAEKFGCTICHAGQGSATDFYNASHTPNNFKQEELWKKESNWIPNHYWDYSMQPKRFLESSCLKCHHQVTDILPEGNKVEFRAGKKIDAPGAKVVRGYNLVRENGCFGCHEIAGIKNNRWVGPDLRLEPTPPVDEMSPEARAKLLADPLNPPGKMRKVGPSLQRITEKTNQEWVRQWVNSPRSFRPDTKMPHFFNLSNNDDAVLKGTSQENFPEAELHAVTFYLFQKSAGYVAAAKLLPETTLPATYKEDKSRGRQLFTEKGCLACHQHSGTSVDAPGFATKLVSEALFGPNLSRLAAKLGDQPGDAKAKKWLIQWIKDPRVYHPRTFMPITHLEDSEAADISAWLLDQKAEGWKSVDVAKPNNEVFQSLANAYLSKSMTPFELKELFGTSDGLAERLQGVLDPSDSKLAEKLDVEGKLKMYIGRKAINQYGCYACHDIPGFESAKPIGTPLNDWGKKDPERIAFEDVGAFVKKNYYAVDSKLDKEGHGFPLQEGKGENAKAKQPYERFFLEALEHHTREGFLNQKLRDPRSYDYDRLRLWDERLRMPQFKFARGVKPLDGETQEQAEMREEAEAREAVMTFILGLIAEPIPLAYVYDPPAERLAEINGKKVIDKFNCAGCHQVRPGIFEFNTSPRLVEGKEQRVVLSTLEERYKKVTDPSNITFTGDFDFKDHNAWVGRLSTDPNRLVAHGLAVETTGDNILLRLTQAVRFNKIDDLELSLSEREKKAIDIRAGENVGLPVNELVYQADVLGGAFTNLLAPYLVKNKIRGIDDDSKARGALPPPLFREGERTQPDWLYRFLGNPTVIRPATLLRMPRFSLSDEDTKSLVDYFAAFDKVSNPGIGLRYPYMAIPEREQGYLEKETPEYVARLKTKELYTSRIDQLKPIWEAILPQQVKEMEAKIAETKEDVKKAKDLEDKEADPAKKEAAKLKREADEKRQQSMEKDIEELKKLDVQTRDWSKDKAYATDSFRLVANYDLCLNCHKVGANNPSQAIGPSLDLAAERLRPDWTRRWIANPQRLLIYPVGLHAMPAQFLRNEVKYQQYFLGTPLEQATAARDILMNLPKADTMPENRNFRPAKGAKP